MSGMNITNDDSRRPTNGHMPYISLRDAAKKILPFDGKNMPVLQFGNSCINARNMVSPTAECGLVQIIKIIKIINYLVGPEGGIKWRI